MGMTVYFLRVCNCPHSQINVDQSSSESSTFCKKKDASQTAYTLEAPKNLFNSEIVK